MSLLEFFDKGEINYDILNRKKFKNQNNGNLNLEIKFWVDILQKLI